MTASQVLPHTAARGPLSAFVDGIRDAVQRVPDVAEPEAGYQAIARLSGHLAAMWRTVYPSAAGQRGAGAQLRAVCLGRAREVEWALRWLECRLSGEVSAAGLPVAAVSTALSQRLDSYWPAERALVAWVEDQPANEGGVALAREYRRALTRAPTRPHPRCPRSGPLCPIAFWLHGRWDRLLDTMDSRSGVGRDFRALLAQSSCDRPGTLAEEDPGRDREAGPGGVPDLAPGTGQQDKKPTNQEGQCR